MYRPAAEVIVMSIVASIALAAPGSETPPVLFRAIDDCLGRIGILLLPMNSSCSRFVGDTLTPRAGRAASALSIGFIVDGDEVLQATRSTGQLPVPVPPSIHQASVALHYFGNAGLRRHHHACSIILEEKMYDDLVRDTPSSWSTSTGASWPSEQRWPMPLVTSAGGPCLRQPRLISNSESSGAALRRRVEESALPQCSRGFRAGSWRMTTEPSMQPAEWLPGPPACAYLVNTADNLAERFSGRRIVVAGDSISRHFYFALLELAGACYEKRELSEAEKRHCSFAWGNRNSRDHRVVNVRGVDYEFFWATHVHSFMDRVIDNTTAIDLILAADIAILGSGFWHIDHPVRSEHD